MIFSRLSGIGTYLPKTIRSNHDLAKMVETSDEWIFQRTGIRQRHIAGYEETATSMAEQAALSALESAQLSPQDIDLIIVASTTHEKIFPSTACLLQKRLQIPVCPAFDVTAVCTGLVYATSIADKFIQSGQCRHALVVGTEVLSRIVNWQDRRTCILFGDGAGAFVLSADDQPGIIASKLYADGNCEDVLYVDNTQVTPSDNPYITMKGKELFRLSVKFVADSIKQAFIDNQLQADDVDWIIPHQANIRIIDAICKAVGCAPEKVISTLEKTGNTSSASIPLAFAETLASGKIKRGDKILLAGFGGGMTWGTILLQY